MRLNTRSEKNSTKILFMVGGSVVFGAEIAMLNLMEMLSKKNINIHCIISKWNDGEFKKRLNKLNIPFTEIALGFIYFTQPTWTLDTLLKYPRAIWQFLKTKNKFKPDYIYHINQRSVLMLFPFLSKKNNVYHEEDVVPNRLVNKIAFYFCNKKIKLFIAASKRAKESLCEMGITENNIHVILNSTQNFLIDKKTFNKSEIVFAVIGQLIPRKGHLVLINALAIVLRSHQNIKCLVVGSGEDQYKRKITNLIESHDIGKYFQFIDYTSDMASVYQQCDILLLPSFGDACPLVAFESAMCGIPVIGSNIDGIPEIVQDGQTGLLFVTGDPVDLSKKINFLLGNLSELHRMSDVARQHALQNFSSETMAQKVCQVLNISINTEVDCNVV